MSSFQAVRGEISFTVDSSNVELEPVEVVSEVGENGRTTSKVVRKIPLSRSGYVMKLSGTLFVGWQKRFLAVTHDGSIAYYRNEDEFSQNATPRNKFNIRARAISLSMSDPSIIDLRVNTGRHYKVNCGSKENADLWFEVIENHYKGLNVRSLSVDAQGAPKFSSGLSSESAEIDNEESEVSDNEGEAEDANAESDKASSTLYDYFPEGARASSVVTAKGFLSSKVAKSMEEEEIAGSTLSRARCGYAMKKSGQVRAGSGWQKRFIAVSTESDLSYYQNQKDFLQDSLPLGSFHVKSSTTGLNRISETKLELQLAGGRSFQLDFTTKENTDAWYAVLSNHLQG